MREHVGTCQQSDWMIGRCLERADVTAVVGPSCGTCTAMQVGFAASPHSNALATRLRSRECAFAALPRGGNALEVLFGAADLQAAGAYALSTPAITHWKESPFLVQPHCRGGATPAEVTSAASSIGAAWPLMLVGAQKAATLSLYDELTKHPDICYSPALADEPASFDKEKHFFDDPSRCNVGVASYLSRFPRSSGCSQHVDATPHIAAPGIFEEQLVAHRVFYTVPPQLMPSVRIAAVLREPAARTHSWFRHMLRLGEGHCSADCGQGVYRYICK